MAQSTGSDQKMLDITLTRRGLSSFGWRTRIIRRRIRSRCPKRQGFGHQDSKGVKKSNWRLKTSRHAFTPALVIPREEDGVGRATQSDRHVQAGQEHQNLFGSYNLEWTPEVNLWLRRGPERYDTTAISRWKVSRLGSPAIRRPISSREGSTYPNRT